MKRLFPIIFLIILCIPIVQPMFSKGYFSMHDDTQIARVIVMGEGSAKRTISRTVGCQISDTDMDILCIIFMDRYPTI